ncbi:hypothetical protein D3OALGA1CA_5610 [Olavius algarvensis associated proteobacterium Delta 3]|nr:hypothetical protein D3OALGB2SA_42 [Olavius algarvensis associated proteobacterium Delta 3]CAB5169121.1 hypothetical protein D3OALGA1CA_5610 [Olavius algarvensis associated proteobacterium Delta 3]
MRIIVTVQPLAGPVKSPLKRFHGTVDHELPLTPDGCRPVPKINHE